MKQTRLTIEEKPTVQKDSEGYSQLLLNRTNLNDKKSYTFGVETKYSIIPESIKLKYTNYDDTNFIEGNQRENKLSFTGVITTKYGNKEIIESSTENVELTIIMDSPYNLDGTYIWHGIPVLYHAEYGIGTARVLYAREKADKSYEYVVIKISKSIDNQMCSNGWTPIAIHAADYADLVKFGGNAIPTSQTDYDLFIALKRFTGNDYKNSPEYVGDEGKTNKKIYFGLSKTELSGNTGTHQLYFDQSSGGSRVYTTIVNLGKLISGGTTQIYMKDSTTSKTYNYTLPSNELPLMYNGYDITQRLYEYHTSNTSIGSADTIGTNVEDIKFNEVTTCPPAATCVLYKTYGTNQGEWFLPTIAEFYITDKSKNKTNRLEIDNAIEILLSNGHTVDTIDFPAYWTSTALKTGYEYVAKDGSIMTPYGAMVSHDWQEGSPYELSASEVRYDNNKVRPFLKAKIASDGMTVTSIFGRK